jgi:DNA-binding transcriptional ArsR family regulator
MARSRLNLSPDVVQALGHPLRFRILVELEQRVASPKQLSDALGEPLGRVGHHVRMLARLGAVELVSTRPRRGAIEHFYRALVRPLVDDEVWAALPLIARRAIFASTLERIATDTARAAGGGGFDHPLAHVSYTVLELDDTGRAEMAGALLALLRKGVEIERRSQQRAISGGLSSTELVAMHFDRDEPD